MSTHHLADSDFQGRILALTGGVGGAKLARGLAGVLKGGQLTIAANTADDFDYWGLRICPDLDSVMYALADLNDETRGWGLKDESWRTGIAMRRLGGDEWFQIGDQDAATHIFRSQMLATGSSLAEVTEKLCCGLGIAQTLLPMSEDKVATKVNTDQGWLEFQEYFVRDKCEPEVRGLAFDGIETAQLHPAIVDLLQGDELAAVIICPSNPFVSVDPILSIPGCRALLNATKAPVIAVSPIIAGRAVKGPAAKMMRELAMPATATAVAQHYGDLLDGYVLDEQDADCADDVASLGIEVCVAPTMMSDVSSKMRLAEIVLDFAAGIALRN
ncbi:LPPG:FO 2-phospho-L-lactate transferase [Zhongshania antarctica]|uniref:LPPG:FO 2-phospho-L-lactate transferase n=1 Tax=Zhongshania antarctica TaxID=641702 RepID=A0A840QZC7_9GAMM|nr:2-phospho-L-lactate transferase [Zhongshania antarctica]MBB5186065.1 LPPG:FO 2-phospho-L-lactate transferase [Zhongshania antarctica]